MAKDPVCGMTVRESSPYHFVYQGRIFISVATAVSINSRLIRTVISSRKTKNPRRRHAGHSLHLPHGS